MVSQAEASGEVAVFKSLGEVQGKAFEEDTIIIAEDVGGNEDIPVSMPPLPLTVVDDSGTHCRAAAWGRSGLP